MHTVCESARCPNIRECFSRRYLTVMILGNVCTRNCSFCAVTHGQPVTVDTGEPQRVADLCAGLGLRYVVITSVTRDDLADGGAGQFAATVGALHTAMPQAGIEVLVPDFAGHRSSIETVIASPPSVFAHNLETVPGLYPQVRPQANYDRSLDVLRWAKESGFSGHTKSGLMLGLGETEEQVRRIMEDLRRAGCDLLVLGQYLQPTRNNLPVAEYLHPEKFSQYKELGLSLGFIQVLAEPLARSSYHAGLRLEG